MTAGCPASWTPSSRCTAPTRRSAFPSPTTAIESAHQEQRGCFVLAAFRRPLRSRRPNRSSSIGRSPTLYAENVVGTSTVMARTDLFSRPAVQHRLSSAEDWDLWLTLAGRAPVGVVPQVLADYLMHRSGNLTRRMDLRVMAMRLIGERHRPRRWPRTRPPTAVSRPASARRGPEIAEAAANDYVRRLEGTGAGLQPTRRAACDLMGAIYQPMGRSV